MGKKDRTTQNEKMEDDITHKKNELILIMEEATH